MKRILIELEALSPISHGDTHSGIDNGTNMRLFMRSNALVNGVATLVPDISANALRTVMFRIPLADHLIEALGIERGTLPRAVMNLLFSGGSMAGGAKSPSSEGRYGIEIRSLYPSLGLLGGSVDNFILPRSKMRVAAWPVAREFSRAINVVCPRLSHEAASISAYDLVKEETRIRGTGSESDGNQMIYTYETLAAGAKVLVELTLDANASNRDLSCVALALNRWDGYFGGQGRQGRGRMAISSCDITSDESLYLEHITEHGAKMKQGLIGGALGTDRPQCFAN